MPYLKYMSAIRIHLMVILTWIMFAVSPVAQASPPMIQLKAGVHRVAAEVAATVESRDRGLMKRRHLPANRGMLFVFPEVHRHCMWMQNTTIPLSVAFIEDNGTIVNIADMQPNTETHYCADRPVHYVLEMNKGWFSEKGLGPGDQISGLRRAPPGK